MCNCSAYGPYINSSTPYGFKTINCPNGCGGTTSDRCYCTSACTAVCPSPLAEEVTLTNLILDEFASCNNGCQDISKDCWEVLSDQPYESVGQIQVDSVNRYGFQSVTHSGLPVNDLTLNNTVRIPVSYEDFDGYQEIKSMGVWFQSSTYSQIPNTPVWLSSSPTSLRTNSDSWGFMLKKINENYWVPYIPTTESNTWVIANISTDPISNKRSFMIPGPSGGNMVEIKIEAEPYSNGYGRVFFVFDIRFSGENINDNVAETEYKMFLLGLDEFSFVPYDYYSQRFTDETHLQKLSEYWQPNQMRYKEDPVMGQTYAREWSDTGVVRTIDRASPSFSSKC